MASNTDALNNSLRYPFSNDPAADVIIRSQSIDFRVRKAVLSETSGLFKQMFTLPQGGDNGSSPADRSFSDERSVDGLPVISVSEDEETMSTFLRLCYPSADHTISSLEEARTALKTLQKYDIPYIPDSILLLLTLETSAHPTAVYAIACGYNLTSIANQAARASLRKPLLHDTISREDFALMSSYHYDLLLRYHTRCCAAASETAVSFHWMKDIYESSLFIKRKGCTCPTTHRDFRGPSARVSLPALNWVIEFMRECAEELKVTPCWDGVMGRGRAMMRGSVAAMKRECGPCMEAVEKLPAFAEDIGRQVELAISQVDPPF